MSAQKSVILTQEGNVAVLRLNEPESMNALSGGIREGLSTLIPQVVADPAVRAIVITGTGKAFCAGGDIRNMKAQRDPTAVRNRMLGSYVWLTPLMKTDKPVVTAINGAAAGAGLALALMGDVILASDEAKFRAGFPGVGATPDFGVIYSLPRAVGVPRAKDILMSNRMVGATEAAAMGLVSRLVPAASLMEEAMALAAQLGSGPMSLGLTKQLMRRTFETSFEAFLENEALAQATAFSSADFNEGVDAFLNKRKANFPGG